MHYWRFYARGTTKWSITSSRQSQTSPVIGMDGTVFVAYFVRSLPLPGPNLAEVGAVRTDGTLRWKFPTGQTASPILALSASNVLYVASVTNLYALSAETGQVFWQMPSPNNGSFGPPVLDYDGTLYAPTTGGILALRTGAGPAPTPWPMYRQNPRQSACVQRSAVAQIRAFCTQGGDVSLEVAAPNGALILQSTDLST
jgi:outer membrane protein assembly factor BamB